MGTHLGATLGERCRYRKRLAPRSTRPTRRVDRGLRLEGEVVDEADVAEPHGGKDGGGLLTTSTTGASVCESTISRYSNRARGSASIREFPRATRSLGVVLAGCECISDDAQCLHDAHRRLTIVGAETLVATRDRQPIGLAHRRDLDDLDVHVEVGDHAPDDRQLLKVLAAEHRDIGPDGAEQLGDDGGDATEVSRAPGSLERRRPASPARRGSGSPPDTSPRPSARTPRRRRQRGTPRDRRRSAAGSDRSRRRG